MAGTLITGATGHLGNNLMRIMLKKGRHLRAGVHHSANDDAFQGVDVEKVRLELLDRTSLENALRGVEILYHTAAPNRIWDKKPDQVFLQRELDGTRNLLEEAKKAGVKKIIFTSTIFAAGIQTTQESPIDENSWYSGNAHPFFKAKVESEKLALNLAKELDLHLVSVVPGLMAGPYAYYQEDRLPLMMDFIQAILRNYYLQMPAYYFPLVDIRDVVDGMLRAEERGKKWNRYLFTADSIVSFAEISKELGRGDQIILLPRKEASKWRTVLRARRLMLSKLMGSTETGFTPRLVKTFWGLTPYNDNSKAKKELGWEPRKAILAAHSAELWLQIDRKEKPFP